ncbi:MAG: hypothetical protein GY788_21215 [bacterium]|nr:hypothetical protein [bacterium]
MTRQFETIELDVCADCLMFIANGDTPEPACCDSHHWSDDSDHEPVSADGWAVSNLDSWDGWNLIAGGCECEHCADDTGENPCEGWFSWSSCEACGSSLGGDRYHATAMREVVS